MAKVMIVDDSAYARRVHRGILERAGYDVIEAATGSAAIETFALARPDVVLLDLSMEDIGGIDVLRALHQIDADARVIVVTADVQRSTAEAVLAAGAERLVPKPADPEELKLAINDALRGSVS